MTIETLKDESNKFSNLYVNGVNKEELYSKLCHLKQIHGANISHSHASLPPLVLINKITELSLEGLFPNL